MEIIGWYITLIVLIGLSVSAFLVTKSTIREGLVSMKWYYKIIGRVVWVGIVIFWVLWIFFVPVAT